MRCLTLQQPWASLMAWGEKHIETRSWSTTYIGPLAIHASKGFAGWAKRLCWSHPVFSGALARHCGGTERLPLGAVIAVVELVRCVPTESLHFAHDAEFAPHDSEFGDYEAGRWAWMTRDVVALPEPILCKGALGVWTVPEDVEREVRRQLSLAGSGVY